MPIDRRTFLRAGSVAASAALLGPHAPQSAGAQSGKTYRAAIIGRTGGGNYGHAYDMLFDKYPHISVEAIADSDPEGLKVAGERSKAKRKYLDYHEMLQKEKPQIVVVATRHAIYHRDMALAAIEVGAHLFIEKPITDSLEDADAIMSAADARGVKVMMAHKYRLNEKFRRIKRLIQEGFIGTPMEVRGWGSQDNRVGGEDMIVLGTHEFDMVRYYFGNPEWCFASVTESGRDITREDVHLGTGEPVLVAGDSIRATYAFPENVQFTWSSVKTPDNFRGKRGLTVYGTERIIAFHHGPGPAYLDSPLTLHLDDQGIWKPLPEPKTKDDAPHEHDLIHNLIHAIETDTQPLCSGHDGRWTIEMVAAAYESQRTKSRVDMPLRERRHPLTLL